MRSPPASGTLLAMTAASHRNQKRLLAPAEAEVRLDGVVAAHNSHDPSAVAAHFTPDGVVRIVPTGDTVQGHEQITAFFEANLRAFPDWQLERRGVYDCADGTWMEWTITGTHADEFMGHPATHRGVELLGCSCFDVHHRRADRRGGAVRRPRHDPAPTRPAFSARRHRIRHRRRNSRLRTANA